MTSMVRDYFTLSASQKATVGDTKMSVTSADHLGWMKCDGRLLNVADFYFLFQLIGYSFGGSGTQFALPSAAGHVLGAFGRGAVDQFGNPLTNRALGSNAGEETHTLTVAEMPTHNHTGTTDASLTGVYLTDPGHNHTGTTDGAGYARAGITMVQSVVAVNSSTDVADNNDTHTHNFTTTTNTTGITLTDPTHVHTFTTSNEGGSNAHNNMQPTLFIGNVFIYSGKTTYGNYPYSYPYYPSTLVL